MRNDEFVNEFKTLAKVIEATGANLSSRTHSVEEIAKNPVIFENRLLLIREIDGALSKRSMMDDDDLRTAVVKVAIALLPETSESLLAVLARHSRWHHEMHFTIFCFLSECKRIPRARDFAVRVPEIAEHYLKSLKRDPALSGWMAADMLGEQWEVGQALQTLVRVANSTESKAGRMAALYGLAEIAKRPDADIELRSRAIQILDDIGQADPDKKVHVLARSLAQLAGK